MLCTRLRENAEERASVASDLCRQLLANPASLHQNLVPQLVHACLPASGSHAGTLEPSYYRIPKILP